MKAGHIDDTVLALLAASLPAWSLSGSVRRAEDGAIEIEAAGTSARIEAPPPGLPFRYVLVTAERTRGLMSIAALLRAVRTLGDPDYHVAKLRIAPFPVVVP